ncbi:putative mercury resistance operon repressor [Luteimicrobium xylanilyticum]|uniref:Putative mercury resistance operon repressor n=1 Tax=Luteimicrobium xylanilyticum TaxID=1133546 RepID=A0A5P9Q621_9MICO|nr:metalloregulator ArsR/SmtB family transcription factor [Luteimicrobium xylanilyticum]QFU96831.1 putative mercury resistance operon repressor [Luteimicrobium xylanilyticum]
MAMTSAVDDSGVRDGGLDAPEAVSALLRAAGEPARLTILQHLFEGPHRVRDLVEHLGLAQSTVSAHVACLRECGLVEARPVGRAVEYRLAHPDLVRGLLDATLRLLDATGFAVLECASVPAARAVR